MKYPINHNHLSNYFYMKSIMQPNGSTLNVFYKDMGWLNSGIKPCDHKKEDFDNSVYRYRGTDQVIICHTCKKYWHIDMSD